ncbi:MAG: NusG domain II-containing protein [Vallitaleaceae bacterium]|nr:NusG domain II-containing protein [Vallitaleaceae bacterium]
MFKIFKIGDIVVLAVVALIIALSTVGVWMSGNVDKSQGSIAVIRQNNKEIKRIDLNKVSKPETIVLDGNYENKIIVENGRIRFIESNCKDLVCVKVGWLQKPGDMAVCLPNKTSIRLQGKKIEADAVDGVTF